MKVALFADCPNWIIDRIAARMAAGIHGAEHCGFFCELSTDEILKRSDGADIVHLLGWNAHVHIPRLLDAHKRVLISIRSHRYSKQAAETARRVSVHTITTELQAQFPGSHYIPDGLMVEPQPLRVGCAFHPNSREYKGVALTEQACREIGAEFLPASGDIRCLDMSRWFDAIDVYCCASIAEGHSTPVMEALALNKPVVSTRVGLPWCDRLPGITWTERSVAGIKAALRENWPSRYLEPYRWPAICDQFTALYTRLTC